MWSHAPATPNNVQVVRVRVCTSIAMHRLSKTHGFVLQGHVVILWECTFLLVVELLPLTRGLSLLS